MGLDPALPQEVDRALARGWTVLTANQRAARTLRRAYDARQPAEGRATWQPPALLAWDTWLDERWRQLLLSGNASALLLNRTQEHALWTAIIASDVETGAASSLRPVAALAELAAGAWQLVHAYHARRTLTLSAVTADTRAFARWAAEFERRAQRAQTLTAAELPETLRAAFASRILPAPLGLLLVGFDAKAPVQSALLEALRTAGSTVEELVLPEPAGQPTLAAAPGEQDELAACGRWLRAQLVADPSASLAVIVPDLEAQRAAIDRCFRDLLAPELHDITATTVPFPYEFSLGVPLARTALAACALDLLRWAVAPLPLDRITALLLSPYFAPAPAERLARAEFDAFTLRQQRYLLQPELSVDAFLRITEAAPATRSLPVLLRQMHLLGKLLHARDLVTDRSHADWSAAFHDVLEAAGWTYSADDTSVEFQTRRKWEGALDELATLDFDGSRVSYAAALAALERIAAQTLFAPESQHAPIQIMGPLESAGSTFDALWLLRAGDLTWPATPAPHPLLAWTLQRELGMPGADAARDAAHGRRTMQRIAASAPTVVFSYALQTADAHQRPSPSLSGLALIPCAAAGLAPAACLPEPVLLENVPDDGPMPPPPDRVLTGGARVLELQAACSFRAFAERRLFATAPDNPGLGLDPGERGTLVHSVLERFWVEVASQAALQALRWDERDTLLSRAIDETLARAARSALQPWPLAYLATERQRLLNLLRPWLDFEATRPDFTILALERRLPDVSIGPLRLDIRVDRIDATSAGELILDYKTGAANHADWLGERPDAPQLPLYAVVSDGGPLAGIAFASVRAGKDASLAGYAAAGDVLAKPAKLKDVASLDEQVEAWRSVLTALAEEFHAGDARAAPKQYPRTCSFCEQRLLCRLDPASLQAESIEQYLDEYDPDISPAGEYG